MSALKSLILALLIHPDVQKRAQHGIDGILEGARLPDIEDMDRLSFVTAIAREVQRWQPVTPLAIPHLVTAEDEYEGYRIPANSTVIGNSWAMLHDDAKCPDPFAFKPQRWLLPDGTLNPDMKEPSVAFGFGRRICPGRHVASSSIWIMAAMLFAAFEFTHAVDEDGNTIKPSLRYCPGLIPSPLPSGVSDLKPLGNSSRGFQILDGVTRSDHEACRRVLTPSGSEIFLVPLQRLLGLVIYMWYIVSMTVVRL